MRTIYILTSGDYSLAGSVALNLSNRSIKTILVDVVPLKYKSNINRKLKIFFLLGLLGATKYFYTSFLNARLLKKNTKVVNESEIDAWLDIFLSDGFVFLINYSKKISPKNRLIYNCHPGKIPDYRGLFPIPRTILNQPQNNIVCTSTLHIIDHDYDMGFIVSSIDHNVSLNKGVFSIYQHVYTGFVEQIVKVVKEVDFTLTKVIDIGAYSSKISWFDVFVIKFKELSSKPFLLFLINGGIIGVLSWGIQYYIFKAMLLLFNESIHLLYMLSVLITFACVVILNFISQKKVVFRSNSNKFLLFIFISLVSISMVSCLSYFLHVYFSYLVLDKYSYFIYPISAILISPITFFMKKNFVFKQIEGV